MRFALAPTTASKAREIEVYTTRPDTLFGAKFMAIAPDHPLAAASLPRRIRRSPISSPNASACGTSEAAIETAEKKGYDTGLKVRHPFDADWPCRSMSPISC